MLRKCKLRESLQLPHSQENALLWTKVSMSPLQTLQQQADFLLILPTRVSHAQNQALFSVVFAQELLEELGFGNADVADLKFSAAGDHYFRGIVFDWTSA